MLASVPLRTIYLFFILLFVASLLLRQQGMLDSVENPRLTNGISQRAALGLAKSWNGLPVDSFEKVSGDDPAPVYLIGWFFYRSYSKADLMGKGPFFISPAFFYLVSSAFLLSALLLFFAFQKLHGTGFAFISTLLFVCAGTTNRLAGHGLVYLFPCLSLALLLAWAASVKARSEVGYLCSFVAAAAVFYADLFRESSWFLLLYPVLLLAFPRWIFSRPGEVKQARRNAAIYLATFLALAGLDLRPAGHGSSSWASVYTGLFEFGGWYDPRSGDSFPGFEPAAGIPSTAQYRDSWNDDFATALIHKTDPNYRIYTLYKPEYEALFRDRVFFYLKKYPFEIARLLGKRLWRSTVFFPWQKTDPLGYLDFQEPRDTVIRLIWLAVIIGGLCRGAGKEPLYRLLLLAFPLAIPLLLVHSGLLLYSIPFHVVAYFLFVLSLLRLWQARSIAPTS